MVNIMGDQYMAISSTVNGPDAVPGQRDASNAIYMLDLGGLSPELEAYDTHKKSWTKKAVRVGLTLFLDVTEGQIRDGVIVASGYRTHENVDVSGLTLEDGKLTGELAFSVNPNRSTLRLPDGKTSLELARKVDCAVTEDGGITGADGKRQIGRLLNRPAAMPEEGTIWFRFTDIPHSRIYGFAVGTLVDGKIGETTVMYNKGLPLSTFANNTITLDADGLSGSLAGDLTVWSTTAPCRIEWKGRRFGNRMILGDYTLTWGETVIKDRFRGGIVADGAPPLVNMDPAILAVTKPVIEKWKRDRAAKRE